VQTTVCLHPCWSWRHAASVAAVKTGAWNVVV
jgi:hypothetical protein